MSKPAKHAKSAKKKRAMRSFEAEPDVEAMLDKAVEGGAVFKEIVNKAIRKAGPEILRELAEEMREQAKKVEEAAKQSISADRH